jgi:hypothetical protein
MSAPTRRGLLKIGGFGAGITVAGLALPLGESASTKDWISTAAQLLDPGAPPTTGPHHQVYAAPAV